MSLFSEVVGDTAILSSGGVYKQASLFTREGYLFAQISAGRFVRLYADGHTSKTNTHMIHLETTLELYRDRFGRLGTKKIKDPIKLESPKLLQLTSGV